MFIAIIPFGLLSLFRLSEAAVALQLSSLSLEDPTKCYVNEDGKESLYAVGEHWQIKGQCMDIACYDYKGTLYLKYASCPVVHAEPPCKLVENPELAYPQCCPRFECPSIDELEEETNMVFTGDEDELYMAASEHVNSPVVVAAPAENFAAPEQQEPEEEVPADIREADMTVSYDATLGEDDFQDSPFDKSPFTREFPFWVISAPNEVLPRIPRNQS